MNKLSILTKGIIKENPVLVLLLGCCPTLATTTGAINGLGMGVSTLAVLVCSGFVTIVQLLLKAYLPALDAALGLFIPLIVVNCIILGRAEMFASKNSVLDSALDGLGMGIGFTLALGCMGLIREFLGSGTAFDIPIYANTGIEPAGIFMLAPGGFFVFAILIAAINYFSKGKAIKKKEIGCEGCAMADSCGGACDGKEADA